MAWREKEDIKRAESVRQRRVHQIKPRAQRKVNHAQALSKAQTAPIFVRRGVVGIPVIQRARTNVKRKFTFPLTNGTEVTMPALPLIKPGWRLLSGFIAVAGIVFLFMTLVTSIFDVKGLTVIGLQRLNPTDLSSVLKLENSPIYAINPMVIRQELETAFPELYDIRVKVEFPTSLSITATERVPVLAWQYQNLTLWIDKDGYIFPPRGAIDGLFTISADKEPPRLKVPVGENEVVEGQTTTTVEEEERSIHLKDGPVDPEFIQEVLDLHQRMPDITTLSYNASDGFGWHDNANDWNLYLGHRLDMLDQKLLIYEKIKAMILEKGLRPNLISVAYLRAPYFRLEQ